MIGGWKAALYSPDTVPDPFPVAKVALTGSTVTIQLNDPPQVYQGTISADGTSISGKLAPGGLPLELQRATPSTAWDLYDTAKSSTFVTVAPGVRLEVLDWGGTGRALILLAGLGNSARVFDKFAPKLTQWYHVYGITRRGFGNSSVPASGYSADRLGQDVLAVIDALKITDPILVGHSAAGEELSYVGSEAPSKVAGLVYLDAGYSYAFYSRPTSLDAPNEYQSADLYIDAADLRHKLDRILFTGNPSSGIAQIDELLQVEIPLLKEDLQEQRRALQSGEPVAAQMTGAVRQSILAGESKFTKVHAPILAIYADPHSGIPVPKGSSAAQAAAADKASVENEIAALKRYNPSAQVVRLPNAMHYLYVSNEAEVINRIHTFIDELPNSNP
ncbi:MAG TPA: alpha/beta hydrolase [Steroidobacteraceae bacterium]|nr:alpha/beta hydrolase [Steroidobacteraceae bacterium]